MGERTRTVEIEGFGPVTIRKLSRGRMNRIRAMDRLTEQAVEVVRAGLVEPELTHELARELGTRLDVLDEMAAAIAAFADEDEER